MPKKLDIGAVVRSLQDFNEKLRSGRPIVGTRLKRCRNGKIKRRRVVVFGDS